MENKTGAGMGVILGFISKIITQGFLLEIVTTIILSIVGATVGFLTQMLIKKYFKNKA